MPFIETAAQYIIKAQTATLGKSLLSNTPKMDPMNIIGIEMNAYWYCMIG